MTVTDGKTPPFIVPQLEFGIWHYRQQARLFQRASALRKTFRYLPIMMATDGLI